MEIPYLNAILWVVGALIAVSILMTLMRRRRDQLVESLREYVEKQQDSAQNDSKST